MLHGVRPPSRDDDERRTRYRCQAVMINALQRPAADYLERDMVGATHKTHVARAHTHGRRRRMRCCKGQCAQTSRIGLEMHAVREMVRVAPHEREGLCHNLWASRLRLGGSHRLETSVSHVPRDTTIIYNWDRGMVQARVPLCTRPAVTTGEQSNAYHAYCYCTSESAR